MKKKFLIIGLFALLSMAFSYTSMLPSANITSASFIFDDVSGGY